MKPLDFSRHALTSCAAAAMLAGCGGSQPPMGAARHTQLRCELRAPNRCCTAATASRFAKPVQRGSVIDP